MFFFLGQVDYMHQVIDLKDVRVMIVAVVKFPKAHRLFSINFHVQSHIWAAIASISVSRAANHDVCRYGNTANNAPTLTVITRT